MEVRGGDPLCSCGRGKDVEGMRAVELWRDFAPLVTRIALSPLFAVSYLEQVRAPIPGEDTAEASVNAASRCSRCNKPGRLRDFKKCGRCRIVMYCSKTCQRSDWKAHKLACATLVQK
ncbi:uncharacterized protein TRAVEDRAFT_131350 [Trametes versicolor FP-101664 SS1]|uniref:uncharacterized protein n=1 Tax=Trametes versicolor (strain FP-101664) TaxID=717944 RepID=UPI0004623A1C|nr:uncharacterized protein TRAVEDRAFT_131350 [Trametes versicolor FP-101664 SS1]EIW55423.1 hypothetical protein TRAVEDRAFT_131350 [Trametes versicolor FP-101664 SS1]